MSVVIPKRPIEIVIAEKNPLLQTALKRLFDADERFTLVAMAADGERFLAALEKVSFDIGIIGWDMPYLGGKGVLEALKGRDNAPRIVIYSGTSAPEAPREAMAHGAAGYASKLDPPDKLIGTILAVAAGSMMFPFMDMTRMSEPEPFVDLTPRERELLAAVAGGLTNAQVAAKLDISQNTVKFHLKNLYDKLHVSNRAQAVAYYLKEWGNS